METERDAVASRGTGTHAMPSAYERYMGEARTALAAVSEKIGLLERKISSRTSSTINRLREERHTIAHEQMRTKLQLTTINGEHEKALAKAERLKEERAGRSWFLSRLLPSALRNDEAIRDTETQIATLKRLINLSALRLSSLENRLGLVDISMGLAIAEADDSETIDEIGRLKREEAVLKKRHLDRRRILDLVDAQFPGVAKNALAMELKLSELREKKISVAEMTEALRVATSSAERKQVHIRCESIYGTAQVRDVARAIESEIRRTSSNLEKLEKRIMSAIRRASLTATSVVIDGSNLCYAGNTFAGLDPLVALVAALKSEQWIVRIVFDRSITRLLKRNAHSIKRAFGDMAEVHVMNGFSEADEFILDLAHAKDALVISGDRFADYPDKDVIQSGRVVAPEVFSGVVRVADLNIFAVYDHPGDEVASRCGN